MSEERVGIVKRLFEQLQQAADRGEWLAEDYPDDDVADDFEWVTAPEMPGPTTYRGRDGFLEFMVTWTEDFDSWSIRPERVIEAADDRVVAIAHQVATGKGSGVEVALHFGVIFDFAGDQLIRARNYLDPAEALEAAGLSE